MKRSFVEVADSPYQLKKMIEESLRIKAAGILSNPDFQQAAALGLLEFQDNDDQLTPNLTPDELLKFFSQVVSYHDNEHPQGTLKRISSKTDTHSEEPNEDLESAYKKLFGTSIDKDPAFKHFFESEQLDEKGDTVPRGNFGYHGRASNPQTSIHQTTVTKPAHDNNGEFAAAAKARKRAADAAKNNQQKPTAPLDRIKSAVSAAFGKQNSSFEETYKNFIAEYEAVLEENGIYEYDLDEATEFFIEMQLQPNSPYSWNKNGKPIKASAPHELPKTSVSKFVGNGVTIPKGIKTDYGIRNKGAKP